ncbi:histone deacetylase HDT1-like [Lotus japonicus]|uniref:C2H2-type domain-containing protein n=1 Tax=Lotus japonicus TaxID=34305 RepID=I3T597_LOTJA|nr:histone deacetylase HDT1-like [Lotus japonicus]AFK47689.1 unknown [Lotus japonicus]
MEFWGVEVKSGESLKVDPEDDKIVHLSMACLGDVSKDKGSEAVSVYVKFGDQKLALGTLSADKYPQISYDLIFEKEFELSHNWKHGSVFFTGFKAESQAVSDGDDEDSDDSDGEDIPISVSNGKPEIEVKNSAKPNANEAKQKEKITDLKKNENNKGKAAIAEDEEDSSGSDTDNTSEDEPMPNGGVDSSEDDDDSDDDDDEDDDEDEDDDDDDEETPKKAEGSKKRVLDSPKNTPVPVKKAKFVTPQKTDSKNVAHVATPYPKQAGKASASTKQPAKPQTPKSGGEYSCKPCNRSFKTEDALGSHNKAKHSAAK